jgi:hypothetical protein
MPKKIVLVNTGDILLPKASLACGEGAALDDPSQLLDLLAVDRIGADADLEAVEVRRVVASRNHDTAVGLKMANGEIKHGCGAKTDVDNIHTGGSDSPADDIMIGLRAETAIPAQSHLPDAMAHGICADCPAQKIDKIRVQISVHYTPDIILSKDFWIHFIPHGCIRVSRLRWFRNICSSRVIFVVKLFLWTGSSIP